MTLSALEDLGYWCCDNIPVDLVPQLVQEHLSARPTTPLAIGLDVLAYLWSGKSADSLRKKIGTQNTHWLFLSCEVSVLLKRYQETRRPHPMRKVAGLDDLKKAIESNVQLLEDLLGVSDVELDSSLLSARQLRRVLEEKYGTESNARSLVIKILSFGFKHGAPRPLDLLFDVRFLRNPHYIPELKPKTGKTKEIQDFVFADESFRHVEDFFKVVQNLIPLYRNEGKSYLNIGIGCTGGKHRSVASAERLHAALKKTSGVDYVLDHRDIDL